MLDFSKGPLLIGEIGGNHNRDIKIIKRLIDACFSVGFDFVKFQKRTPELCVPDNQKNIMKDTPWGKITYLEYKKKMELSKEDYDYIDKYCKEKPLEWTCSVWDLPSLEFIMQYDVPFIKIPSAKLTDLKLIRKACQTNKEIILSTGMSTLDEIDKAVSVLEDHSIGYVLMHTNSAYPSSIEDINLKMILTLRERYGCHIGYSGHEVGLEPSVAAVAYGAKIIERHITIDHTMWGTDQASSLEIMAMDMLKKRITSVYKALGNGIKRVTETEKEMIVKLRGE